jgi:hypothetical protein
VIIVPFPPNDYIYHGSELGVDIAARLPYIMVYLLQSKLRFGIETTSVYSVSRRLLTTKGSAHTLRSNISTVANTKSNTYRTGWKLENKHDQDKSLERVLLGSRDNFH